MSTLTIAVADLRRLCGLDAGDTSEDAALEAVQTAEQSVVEYALDPDQLAASATDPGLSATLTLGAAEVIAGRYLQQAARAPGALDNFSAGGLSVTTNKLVSAYALGQQLAATGAERLRPYGRAGRVAAGGPGKDLLAAPPPSVSNEVGVLSTGFFGSVNSNYLGTDDAEPPPNFQTGELASEVEA